MKKKERRLSLFDLALDKLMETKTLNWVLDEAPSFLRDACFVNETKFRRLLQTKLGEREGSLAILQRPDIKSNNWIDFCRSIAKGESTLINLQTDYFDSLGWNTVRMDRGRETVIWGANPNREMTCVILKVNFRPRKKFETTFMVDPDYFDDRRFRRILKYDFGCQVVRDFVGGRRLKQIEDLHCGYGQRCFVSTLQQLIDFLIEKIRSKEGSNKEITIRFCLHPQRFEDEEIIVTLGKLKYVQPKETSNGNVARIKIDTQTGKAYSIESRHWSESEIIHTCKNEMPTIGTPIISLCAPEFEIKPLISAGTDLSISELYSTFIYMCYWGVLHLIQPQLGHFRFSVKVESSGEWVSRETPFEMIVKNPNATSFNIELLVKSEDPDLELRSTLRIRTTTFEG